MTPVFQIVLVFVFLCSASKPALARRTTTRTPFKPSLDDAQDKFLSAQNTIIRIRAGEVVGESLEELKARLTLIQKDIEQLLDSSNNRNAESEHCQSVMKSMTNSYDSLYDRIRNLQLEFERHTDLENRSNLLREIVNDIRSSRFLLADEKFAQLNDRSLIPKIVHEVYAHSEDNFGLILNFAVNVSDNDNCFIVLKTLYEEMTKNGHNNPHKLIILAQAYDTEVRDKNDTRFKEELVSQINATATDVLIKAMKAGDFSKDVTIRNLLEALYDFSPKVSDYVIHRLIDGTYGVVESRALLSHIFVQCITPQSVSGIGYIFWKVKDLGHLNDSVLVLDIASNLYALKERKDFVDISNDMRDSMIDVVNNLPECARNLFFEPSVCLWNRAAKVYLLAADETFNYDTERRNVFTSPSEGVPHGARWIPERKGDDILFRSKNFTNEYLYFAEIEYNAEMRYLFSWIAGGNKDKQSAFTIELLEDGLCYLKSSRFNEYLYASDVTYKKDNAFSYAFSWKQGTVGGLESKFAWQIRSC